MSLWILFWGLADEEGGGCGRADEICRVDDVRARVVDRVAEFEDGSLDVFVCFASPLSAVLCGGDFVMMD